MLFRYSLIKAINEIVSNPNKVFSVRDLAKKTNLSPASSKYALDYMFEKKMVSLKVVGKTYQYKANLDNFLCKQWKILFNLDLLSNLGIVNKLVKNIKDIHSILLFGSFAMGLNDSVSDIDLLIVTQRKQKIDLSFLEKINKECNLIILSFKEWKNKASENKVFYENIIFDSIVLYGSRPVIF